jgi:hypothetical protein
MRKMCNSFCALDYVSFFRGNALVKNPLNTFLCSMDGKRGSSLLVKGIKRVEPMTNNNFSRRKKTVSLLFY